MGRFLTPDPFGGSANRANPSTFNRYAYVAGDPINSNDPSGLDLVLVDSNGRPFVSGGGSIDVSGIYTPILPIDYVTQGHPWLFALMDAYFASQAAQAAGGGGSLPDRPLPGQESERSDPRKQLLNDCVSRKVAEAQQAREGYIQQIGQRLATSAEIGAARGAVLGAYAGATGFGGMSVGVATIPGGILGAIAGAQIGGAGGALTGLLQEPFWRLWYDLNVFRPALERASVDCAIEILGRPPE